ncbi:MAG TPA: phosphoglycolate phosphatase [Thauera sp.]|nr:phosphoglycolate phosphatase [Thauera sp.]HNS92331.1 phosphoglycolate phosphatase [Thauera sp.]
MSARPRFAARAVLFDLDGTLLDTITDLADAANLTLAELGRPLRSQDEIHSFVGKGIPNLVRRCMTEGTQASDAEIDVAIGVFRRHYAVVNGARTRIYPGITDTLDAMRALGLKLAVVTNKAEAFSLPLLERMGIAHHFDTVISGDTLDVKKPDPAVVRLACERLGVATADALMIGDSANDALAAQAAGMPVLLVTYGYSEGVPVDTIECDGLLSIATDALQYIATA